MKVCVVGMWHLGTVTAACLASMGHEVVGLDSDESVVTGLRAGKPPLFEPGLSELVSAQIEAGRLSFTQDAASALAGAQLVWIAYDTPVDDDDVADVEGVVKQVEALFPQLGAGAVVLISSQLIAGCTRKLQTRYDGAFTPGRVHFAYSPENLRLGKAIEVFTQPDRIVVGANDEHTRELVRTVFGALA
jgi:UDPglucose 6-dehydrogenase